jgi:hypothetical protein
LNGSVLRLILSRECWTVPHLEFSFGAAGHAAKEKGGTLTAHPPFSCKVPRNFLTNSWFRCVARPGFDRLVNACCARRPDSHACWTSCFHGYLFGLSFWSFSFLASSVSSQRFCLCSTFTFELLSSCGLWNALVRFRVERLGH